MICNRSPRLALAAALLFPLAAGSAAGGRSVRADAHRFATYANPIDLPYRYQPGKTPYREAADPTVVRFKDKWWLFASHSQGYWWTIDFLRWNFVRPTGYDVGKYAPTAVEIDGRLYLATSDGSDKIWVTDDPLTGSWQVAATIPNRYWDPALFRDDDGKLFVYYGLSPVAPLHVEQLDPRTLGSLSLADVPASRGKETRGWEVVGDQNERSARPSFVEGSWMTKHEGRYYLEYSAPGTEYRSYANGVLLGNSPTGPFTYQSYSPFAARPTGFLTGAGHGSTFQGPRGRWWHIGTATISKRHPFERRLALFPTSFTASGQLVTDTYLGDYPHYVDGDRALTGWMLLSRRKLVSASSVLDEYPAENAVDEDIRSWWSARTGNSGEWFQIDLGTAERVEAVQINFADQDSGGAGISADAYRYRLDLSDDGRSWRTAIDATDDGRDAPHDYRVLPRPERARYVRLTNVHAPDGGKFSLSDLRVFGVGPGPLPAPVGGLTATRNAQDGRKATVRWSPASHAQFYVVRLGTTPDALTQSFQVYDGQTSIEVGTLNVGQPYRVAVDAVNEAGVRRGSRSLRVR